MVSLSPMITSSKISRAEVSSHYDELDQFYREIWGNHVHHGLWSSGNESVEEATRNLVEHMLAQVPLGPESRVCDIGCGYGETARLIASEKSCAVTGFTVSEKQFLFAAARPTPNVTIRHADWLENDLEDSSVDFAFSIESSEHMPSLARFFEQAHRVLKPGGTLAIYAWLENEKASEREKKWLLSPLCEEGRMRLYTRAEYDSFADQSDFVSRSFDDVSSRVARTWTVSLKRLAAKLATDRRYQKFVLSSDAQNREFAKTLLRIRLAYATGAMRYGLFLYSKPLRS